jgi:hypothetical protein
MDNSHAAGADHGRYGGHALGLDLQSPLTGVIPSAIPLFWNVEKK